LQHLQASLSRLDLSIQRAIRRWQLAGQDPSDPFRGLRVSDAEAQALLARPLASHWGQRVELDALEAAAFDQAERAAITTVRNIEQAAQQHGARLHLHELATTFQLDSFDLDAFLICLAPALDLRYERLYAYLQDDVTRKQASVNLILDLLAEPGLDRLRLLTHFMSTAPLMKYHLLERDEPAGASPALLAQTLTVEPGIVAWLFGSYQAHDVLGLQATLYQPVDDPVDDLLAAHMADELQRAQAERAVVVLYGPDRASQLSAAKLLARHDQRALLIVSLARVISATITPLQALQLALRDPRLTGSLPCLLDWDACLVDGAPPANMLTELCDYPDVALVLGQLLAGVTSIASAI
jgi:hypothetical protein